MYPHHFVITNYQAPNYSPPLPAPGFYQPPYPYGPMIYYVPHTFQPEFCQPTFTSPNEQDEKAWYQKMPGKVFKMDPSYLEKRNAYPIPINKPKPTITHTEEDMAIWREDPYKIYIPALPHLKDNEKENLKGIKK